MPAKRRRFEVEFAAMTVSIDDTVEQKLWCGDRAVPIPATTPLTIIVDAFIDAFIADYFDTKNLGLALEFVETLGRCDAMLRFEPR